MALGNHGFVFISRFILHKKTEYEKTNGIFILLIQVIAWGQNSNAFPLSSSGSHDLYIRFENGKNKHSSNQLGKSGKSKNLGF